MPPALGTLSLSHWTTREVPVSVLMRDIVAVCANFFLKHFLKWYVVHFPVSAVFTSCLEGLS